MEFDVPYLLRHLPALGRGLALTIQVSALAIVLSVFVGLVGASLRVMRFPVLSQAAAAYVEFIRNTPLLVQLFFVFFGLPTVGLTLSLFWSGVFALTLWAGAFQIENVRGGLASVSPGLNEAARALGPFQRSVSAVRGSSVGSPRWPALDFSTPPSRSSKTAPTCPPSDCRS